MPSDIVSPLHLRHQKLAIDMLRAILGLPPLPDVI